MKTEDFDQRRTEKQCVGGRACRGCVTICEPSVFPNTSAIKKCDTRNRMIMGFIYGVRVRVCVCVCDTGSVFANLKHKKRNLL